MARAGIARAGAVLASLLAAASLAATAGAPARAATPAPSSSQNNPAFTITLDAIDPKVVREGDTLSIEGTVRNDSGETQDAVAVRLRVSPDRIGTRYDLANESRLTKPVGTAIASTRVRLDTLEPGDTRFWHITAPADDLGLPTDPSQFGAYPLEIEVTSAGSNSTRTELPSTLLWMPNHAQFNPTKLAWLVPVVDGVHRGRGDTFLNDGLATDLAPDGRLGKLIGFVAQLKAPLTYAVDPALVDDATAMAASVAPVHERPGASPPATPPGTSSATPTKPAATQSQTRVATTNPTARPSPSPSPSPYRVASGATTVPGAGASTAALWLRELRQVVTAKGSALIALPYGDADLVALDRAGLSTEIALARLTGQSTLTRELAAPTLTGTVWPVDSSINTSTLDDLASDTVDTVILSDAASRPRDPNAVGTPRTDLRTASGAVRAVLTDSTIESLISDPGSVAGGQRAAEQLILAETMLITEQRPGAGSSVALTLPRDVKLTDFVETVLTDTTTMPWLKLVGIGDIVSQNSDDIARQPLDYPSSARRAELPASTLGVVDDLRARITGFESVLGSNITEPFLEADSIAISRAESSSWRSNPDAADRILDAVRADIDAHTNEVLISNPRLITMTSRKQKIPITIVNNLPDPVTVQLRVNAVNAARLKVTPTEPVTIAGKGSRLEVLVEVEATTSGRFQVVAQLMTPGSAPRAFGPPTQFELNSTAYGAVALAIAGGAAGLLFLLSGVRLFRRMRRKRAAPPSPPQPAPAGDSNSPTPVS